MHLHAFTISYYPMSKFLLHSFPRLTARSRPVLLWASRAKDSISDNSIMPSLSVLHLETCCETLCAARRLTMYLYSRNDTNHKSNNGSNAQQCARTTRRPSLTSIHLVHIIPVCTSWRENVSKRMLKKEVCSALASQKMSEGHNGLCHRCQPNRIHCIHRILLAVRLLVPQTISETVSRNSTPNADSLQFESTNSPRVQELYILTTYEYV